MRDLIPTGIENGGFGPHRLKVSVFLGRLDGSHRLIATYYVMSADRIDSFVQPGRFVAVEYDELPLQTPVPESF